MNIVLVLDRLEWGGIASFVDNITSKLVDKKTSVVIVAGVENGRQVLRKEYFSDKRIEVKKVCFFGKKIWKRDWSLIWGVFKTVNDCLRSKKMDLVVINNSASGLGAMMAAKVKRVPVVYHFHGAWNIEEKNGIESWNDFGAVRFWKTKIRLRLYWIVEKICLTWSDKVLVLSEASEKMLKKEFDIFGRRVKIFTPGVDIDFFKPKGKRKKNLLLGIGRNDHKKGWDNLFLAVKKIKNVRLIIGGFRFDKSVKRVEFVGYLDKYKKREYFQNVDLLVVPSIGYEAYPTVIMEAMACGCPVVGTPVGGVEEMLSLVDKNLVTESIDSKALIVKMRSFMSLSNGEKIKLSNRCRKTAELYWNVGKNVDNLLEIYRRCWTGR